MKGIKNLSEEEKEKMQQYGRERYKNFPENEREMLVDYRKNSYELVDYRKNSYEVQKNALR